MDLKKCKFLFKKLDFSALDAPDSSRGDVKCCFLKPPLPQTLDANTGMAQ